MSSPSDNTVLREPPRLPPLHLPSRPPLRPLPPSGRPSGRPLGRPSGRPLRISTADDQLPEIKPPLSYRDCSNTHGCAFSEKKDNYELLCDSNYLLFTISYFPLKEYLNNSLEINLLNNILISFLKLLIDSIFTKDYYNNILTPGTFDTIKKNIILLINPSKLNDDELDIKIKKHIESINKLEIIVTYIYEYVNSKELLQALSSTIIKNDVYNFMSFASFLTPHKNFINDIYRSNLILELLRYYNNFVLTYDDQLTETSKSELRLSIHRLKHVILFLKQLEKFLNDYLPKIKKTTITGNEDIVTLYDALSSNDQISVNLGLSTQHRPLTPINAEIASKLDNISTLTIDHKYVGDILSGMNISFNKAP